MWVLRWLRRNRLDLASRRSYPCFGCQKSGYEDVMVLLDGKDDQGRTKYLNEDGTKHTHLGSSSQQAQPQQQQASTTIVTQSTKEDRILNLLGDLNIKMNRVIKLLEHK
jgi:hypothetical protein